MFNNEVEQLRENSLGFMPASCISVPGRVPGSCKKYIIFLAKAGWAISWTEKEHFCAALSGCFFLLWCLRWALSLLQTSLVTGRLQGCRMLLLCLAPRSRMVWVIASCSGTDCVASCPAALQSPLAAIAPPLHPSDPGPQWQTLLAMPHGWEAGTKQW